MRRRLALLWTLVVLGAVMVLPASTAAAAKWSTAKLVNSCNYNNYPMLTLKLKAKITAKGTSSTDWLRISSKLQHKEFGSSTWVTDQTWSDKNYYYTANGSSHSLSLLRSHTWDDSTSFDYMRIVFTMDALDSNFGGLVSYSKVVKSMVCGGQ